MALRDEFKRGRTVKATVDPLSTVPAQRARFGTPVSLPVRIDELEATSIHHPANASANIGRAFCPKRMPRYAWRIGDSTFFGN